MDDTELEWRSEFHKALSNPERLRIIEILSDDEMCQCDIFPKMSLSQSTVSSYLTQLVKAGILQTRKDGVKRLYKLADPKIRLVLDTIKDIAQGPVRKK